MHPLSQKIADLQRQLVWQRRFVSVCWIVVVTILTALALGLIDYLVRFTDPGLRIMATVVLLAALAWAAYRWWYLPRQERLVPLTVARRVEARFPELQDSLASAVEFLQQSEDDQTAGSAQLRRLVIAEVHNNVAGMPLGDCVESGPVRKAISWLAIAVSLIAVCLIANPSAVGTAFVRLAAPLGSTQWPRQHHLEFRQVPTQLVAGQAFEVELIDTAGYLPDDATIEYAVSQDGGRDVISEPMKRTGDSMITRRENVTHSFSFRAKGGDDDTMPWHFIEVKELPRLSTMTITTHPPAYSGLPKSSAERHLSVLAGTGIEVSGTTSAPIRAARILQDQGEAISAAITADSEGHPARAFHIDPKQWVATQSGPYRLEFTSEGDLAGIVGQWNLRVEPDSPPTVSWQRPTDDLHVLSKAVVPIEVLVKDDLAIKRIDLTYERNDKSNAERAARPKEPPISLYLGPDKPEAVSINDANRRGESRVVQYSWDLAPLQLEHAAVLTVEAEASDYRPAIGRTVGPRRISIINADELETRLAERQLQIARQLERALVIERKTREEVNRLEIQLRDVGNIDQRDRLILQTTEPNQKNVSQMLIDPAEGVPPLIEGILNEIEINRFENSEMGETMSRLSAELKQLSAGPLSSADRELTAARKLVESIPSGKTPSDKTPLPLAASQLDMFSHSLTTVASSQDDVIAKLERLVSELAGNTDYRRLVRQIAEIREDQIAHEKASRDDIAAAFPLAASELTKPQRANLNKAAAGQTAIAARFSKVEQSMEQLARQLAEERDAKAGTVSDGLMLSRQRSIGSHMQQSATDFSEIRVGQALERQHQIVDDLQQLLSMLRNEGERRPQELVDKLKQAEQKLVALQQQLAQLRKQIVQNEGARNKASNQEQRKLNEQQQNVRRDIEQLARELNRSQAAEASKSTQSAANDLNNRQPGEKKPDANSARPSSSDQVKKAEQNLEQAKNQLTQQRQQAEDDLQLDFVRRFQNELGEMVKRQQSVLKNTSQLDAATQPPAALSPDQIKIVNDLATQERQLADQAKEHSELLFGLGSVRVSLEETEKRLLAAAKLLDNRQTASPTQRAEQLALTRLEAMLQTFAQTANEAGKKPDANNPPPPPPAANNQQQQPQRRPTFELLEVKMLRMLQADLNVRTTDHEKRVAAAADNPATKAEFDREARELASEQGRLVELVQKMLSRDNEKQEQR